MEGFEPHGFNQIPKTGGGGVKILCWIFGHNYRHVRFGKFIKDWEKAKCDRCKKEFILNHQAHYMLPCDRELELAMDGELNI